MGVVVLRRAFCEFPCALRAIFVAFARFCSVTAKSGFIPIAAVVLSVRGIDARIRPVSLRRYIRFSP